jgi:hypothetical protein
MKNIFTAIVLGFISLNAFASVEFSELHCRIVDLDLSGEGRASSEFLMEIKLKNKSSAINNSGMDKTIKSDLRVSYLVGKEVRSIVLPDISFRQASGTYRYEIAMKRRVNGSTYDSFISLHPEFKRSIFHGSSLKSYRGEIELNMLIDGHDAMVMKSAELVCSSL